jgi:hypothetical protein
MKGPYAVSVVFGTSGASNVEPRKRIAIRLMRASTKQFGEGAQGEVRDGDGQLVKQVAAYRTQGGAVKLRDLEL